LLIGLCGVQGLSKYAMGSTSERNRQGNSGHCASRAINIVAIRGHSRYAVEPDLHWLRAVALDGSSAGSGGGRGGVRVSKV
jgi:hypothetical protein